MDSPKASNLLSRLNYTRRLSSHVLNYKDVPTAQDPSSRDFCRYYDEFLPKVMLDRMQTIFQSNAEFWIKHQYNEFKSQGYFSYIYNLADEASNIIEQVINLIFKRIQMDDPEKAKRIKYAEWWAHCRPHHMGHQFHYDSENEGKDVLRHPLFSSVLYLDSTVGGPTIITNQTLKSQLANKGWAIFPKNNRLSIFDSSYLHGVVPGKGSTTSVDSRRVTFMVGFWDSIKVISEPGHGASRLLPRKFINGLDKQDMLSIDDSQCLPIGYGQILNSVWQDVEGKELKTHHLVHYDQCFQGF